MTQSNDETIAVRAFQGRQRPQGPTKRLYTRPPRFTLIFDTETTVDASQTPRVGAYRILERKQGLIEEGLFYDRLSAEEQELLNAYAARHELPVLTQHEFLELFHKYAWKLQARVVGFNLPFDLSRLALRSSPARARFFGGFSFVLWDRRDGQGANRFRPRLRVKSLNNRAAAIEWGKVPKDPHAPKGRQPRGGGFLDLRTLVSALTSQGGVTLDRAAEILDTEHRKLGDAEHGAPLSDSYLDYLRRDVLVTEEVMHRALVEFANHPITLKPEQAYSSASIGKAYLTAFGITPPLDRTRLTDEDLGKWLSAFFGGRAECRIRKEVVPVTYVDVTSMYPTVFTLLGLQRFLLAETIASEDATDDVRRLLESITLADVFDPALWRDLAVLVEVEPDNDVLPVRTRYGGASRSIGVNRFSSPEPFYYSLPDVIASKLLTGKAPRIRSAVRLVGEGQLGSLRPVALRGTVSIDPRTDEIFKRTIELRQEVRADMSLSEGEREATERFLKEFANGTSYGISAELNRQEPRPLKYGPLFSRRSFEAPIVAGEKPGRFCFPPFATLVTAAARLILAALEASVAEAGGSYAFCDTDSMAIVTDHKRHESDGRGAGLSDRSDALADETVMEIVRRFDSLSPYSGGVPLLKIETENFSREDPSVRKPLYAYAISAKRYALFNLNDGNRRDLRKILEHGLGTYQSPDADGTDTGLDR